AGDKLVLASLAFGDGSVTWTWAEKRFQTLGGDLAAARVIAEEGHAGAMAALAGIQEEGLDSPRPYYGGTTHTTYELFCIMAEHDLYHAGQINYIRCLYDGERKAGRI